MNNLFENNGAEFSSCRKYRYALWRIWDDTLPLVMIIGVNPSTANEQKNDNTITKVRKVAEHNGFGGFYMTNLFGIISKDPDILIKHQNPVGDNDYWLQHIASKCHAIVFAWGNFKEGRQRAKEIIPIFPDAFCFEQNKNGSPKHPLYCLDKTVFVPFIYK